jgi:hypothetical protein
MYLILYQEREFSDIPISRDFQTSLVEFKQVFNQLNTYVIHLGTLVNALLSDPNFPEIITPTPPTTQKPTTTSKPKDHHKPPGWCNCHLCPLCMPICCALFLF